MQRVNVSRKQLIACVLIVGIFIWVFDAVGGVVVNGIITLVKG